MGAGVLISLEQYLATDYSPDREFVDGVVLERHVGELPHSLVQRNLVLVLCQRYPHLFVLPELRVRTVSGRCRIPDVCVTLERPSTDVLEDAPFLAIEILSRRDEMTEVLEKLEEYVEAGVANVWLVDPRKKRIYTFTAHRLEEVLDSQAVTEPPHIRLELDEVFRGL